MAPGSVRAGGSVKETGVGFVWLVTVIPGRTGRVPALTRAMPPLHDDRPYFRARHRG